MSPFLSEYTEKANIPICTGITALTLNSEDMIILDFGQGLWFGNRMEKSLIKPNKRQKLGIQICDEPTDPSYFHRATKKP